MEIRPFETTVDGLALRGTLTLPPKSSQSGLANGPHPTAVLMHGFGGSRVETTGLFVALARQLARHGIASLAYDRAGHGESDGEFFETTASGDIRQAHEVIDAVVALPEVDAGALHLVGMSLGAVIAAVVAAESAHPIRSLSLWSTAAVFVDEIRGGTLQGRPLDSLETAGYFDFLGMRLGPPMIRDARAFDVYGRAEGFHGPVKLWHGTEDFVPVEYPRRYLDVYGDNAQLTVVPGADHGWAQLPQRDLVIDETVDFVLTQTRGAVRT